MSDGNPRLLVVKAAMTVNGGAERDLLRNLPCIAEKFEVRFACLNIQDSQQALIESMRIEVLCPDNQWIVKGGLWNEITAGQERSAAASWRKFEAAHKAIEWADAIHLTGGDGSMEFLQFIPANKPVHLHYLESKPGIHEEFSHLNLDGSGRWKPKILHLLQIFQRKRIEKSYRGFIENPKWIVSANSYFSAGNLKQIYGITGGVLYPSVDLSEFPRQPTKGEDLAFNNLSIGKKGTYVVTIGRICYFKGTFSAIEVLQGTDLSLIVVGNGSDEEKNMLRAVGHSLGVKVTILSGLSSESMRSIMRNSAAVIGLAKGEAFGLTPIESMALGVPPIFINKGGYAETIVDGENGRLIDEENSGLWKEALEQARDPETKMSWGMSGLARIEELGLTPENHATILEEKIATLL